MKKSACWSVSFTFLMHLSLLLCFFFFPVTGPKPGHCPRLLNVVPSRKGCVCDGDCPAEHKCCVFDCGAVCVPPAFSMLLHLWFKSSQRPNRNLRSCFLVVLTYHFSWWWIPCSFRKARGVSTQTLRLRDVRRAVLWWQRLSRQGEVLPQRMWPPVHCTVHRCFLIPPLQ